MMRGRVAWGWPHIALSHGLTIAFVAGSVVLTGESPRVAVYGYFLYAFYKIVAAWALMHAPHAVAERWTREPLPGAQSHPVRIEDSQGSRPSGLGGYVVVIVVLAYFSGVLVNVVDRKFITSPAEVFADLRWALLYGFVWLVQDLWDRRIVIKRGEPITTNLGYNSTETTVLALTTLIGGVISGIIGSPWPCFIALLFFRHLTGFVTDLKECRYPSSP